MESSVIRPVVILTAFGSFSAGYSLCHVVREQLLAFLDMCHPTTLIVRSYFNEQTLDTRIKDNPLFLLVKKLDDKNPTSVLDALDKVPSNALVISHDLLFVQSLECFAKALHKHKKPISMDFYHLSHSSAGTPSLIGDSIFRCRMPYGHLPLSLSNSECVNISRYYDVPLDSIKVLPNHLHPLRSDAASLLASQSGILDADYAMVTALSMPRAGAKNVAAHIHLIKALGSNARLLIMDAHSDGEEGNRAKEALRELSKKLGVEDRVFIASDMDVTFKRETDNEAVRELLSVSNICVLSSQAEACPLSLIEAAMAGCLLVINRELKGVQELVEWGDVITVDFSVIDQPPSFFDAIACAIKRALDTPMNRSKRLILKQRGRRAYQEALQVLVAT